MHYLTCNFVGQISDTVFNRLKSRCHQGCSFMEALGKSMQIVGKVQFLRLSTRVSVTLQTVSWVTLPVYRGYPWDPLPLFSKPSTLGHCKSSLFSSIVSNLWTVFTFKGPCDYIDTTWIIQDYLLVLKFIALIQCVNFILPCKVIIKEKITFSWMRSLRERTGWDYQGKV